MVLNCIRYQQHTQERRCGWQELDVVLFDSGTDCFRCALLRRHERSAMAEHMTQRIDAADVIRLEEYQRAVRGSGASELLEQLVEIQRRCLALPSRARA